MGGALGFMVLTSRQKFFSSLLAALAGDEMIVLVRERDRKIQAWITSAFLRNDTLALVWRLNASQGEPLIINGTEARCSIHVIQH